MELHTYLAIIRKYVVLFVAAALVGLLGGYGLYATSTKEYAARAQFYVTTPVVEGGNAQSVAQYAASRVTSYAQLLASEELGDRVARAAGVDMTGAAVARKITATTTVDSVVIGVTVTDSNKDRALRIAQGVADTFGPMAEQLDNAGRKSPLVKVATISKPTVGSTPVAPKMKTDLLAGTAAGLVLALLYALLRESLRSTDEPGQAKAARKARARQTADVPAVEADDDAAQPLR